MGDRDHTAAWATGLEYMMWRAPSTGVIADAPARTFVGIQLREPRVTGTMYGYARTDDATRPFA
jgi:hypothetical protein